MECCAYSPHKTPRALKRFEKKDHKWSMDNVHTTEFSLVTGDACLLEITHSRSCEINAKDERYCRN